MDECNAPNSLAHRSYICTCNEFNCGVAFFNY